MRKLKYAVSLLLLTLAGSCLADQTWHLLIEPTFMRYESAWPIPGAQRTVLVPARYVDGEVLPLQRDEALRLGVTRDEILASASKAASEVLAGLKPRFIRDDNNVIQCAILESESALTASAVLAPEFAELFRETIGPEILVAIPNRFRVFVFPKDSPAYQALSDYVIAEYDSSPYPVSKELFSIRKGKLIAVGSYQ
ncbi:MAG TPA: hypothetical protein VFS35_07060, partial [Terrimicrobiaceae bacterium]|nr:hypothetical protein [Terrimicrobiaceae bacterium]